MKRYQYWIVAIISIIGALLVYTPHIDYRFPIHIDEWHHISEAMKLKEGNYTGNSIGFRAGFHIFLAGLSFILPLTKAYFLFPAIWTALTSLLLFYLVHKKTSNFNLALFTMIFFLSLKSNVNILGSWFFTPLSFSFPFIFLYIYFFAEGISNQNKRYIFYSLIIMLLLIPIHSISVLFALPALILYCLINYEYLKKEYKFFSLFLLIPILGIIFYKFMIHIPFSQVVPSLLSALQFKKGWGILELNNSIFEVYSLIGLLLAIIGVTTILAKKETLKKNCIYLLLPLTLILSIYIYRKTNISFLSPYQRNFYYLALSLPILSAMGLDFLIKRLSNYLNSLSLKEYLKNAIVIFSILIAISFAYYSYLTIPEQIQVYYFIEPQDIPALSFVKTINDSKIMAPPEIGSVLYPLTKHNAIASISFYGNRKDLDKFFRNSTCKEKASILNRYKTTYVYSKNPIACVWKEIYSKDNRYIYEVK